MAPWERGLKSGGAAGAGAGAGAVSTHAPWERGLKQIVDQHDLTRVTGNDHGPVGKGIETRRSGRRRGRRRSRINARPVGKGDTLTTDHQRWTMASGDNGMDRD